MLQVRQGTVRCSPRVRLWMVAATALCLGACGTTTGGTSTKTPDVHSDIADTKVADIAADVTMDASADVFVPCVDEGHGGGHGCACSSDDECSQSGLCIEDGQGAKTCAMPCLGGACPAGLACTATETSTGSSDFCVPRYGHLCDPCETQADCEAVGLTGTACVDYGPAGAFCGILCHGDGDCGSGYRCAAAHRIDGSQTQQCVRSGVGGAYGECACSVHAIAAQRSTTCYLAATPGCKGTRTCEAAGLTACSASPASSEVCDGKDNNCNGLTDEQTCDDAKVCTQDACDAAKAALGQDGCTHTPAAGPCNADNDACTQNDQCDAGTCKAGATADCDDKNPCSVDSCDAIKGCQHAFSPGKACDDGNACTANDACDQGLCRAGSLLICDDKNDCTADTCDTQSGACVATNVDGATCSDGDACTIFDGCKDGSCQGKANPCDDGNACTGTACDSKTGCSYLAVSGSCDDGDACTTGEACAGGLCTGGSAATCTASSPCVTTACSKSTGLCVETPRLDGTACSDNTACTKDDSCVGGVCKGEDLNCDDANACTGDSCSPSAGCQHLALTTPCDDGLACTMGDACTNGACVGQAKVCTASGSCVTSSCSPISGLCVELPKTGTVTCDDNTACTSGDLCVGAACAGKTIDCNDNNTCTIDSCDVIAGCKHEATGGGCSDGDACTTGDACLGGNCVGTPIDVSKTCDDNNACTDDTCTKADGCVSLNNSKACDDGVPCTVGDHCGGGACTSGANTCVCATTPDCAAYEDGNLCNGTMVCNLGIGACVLNPATIVTCSSAANTTCETNACVPASGACELQPIHEGLSCDDGSACTESDLCISGACKGSAVSCDDSNVCTSDACNLSSGCTHTSLDSGACDADGNACTTPDTCKNGACIAGAVVVCNDNNPCTLDSCEPATGLCQAVTVTDGTACDDGDVCTGNDLCTAGVCKGTAEASSSLLVAGSGTPGFTDAKGELAQFTAPRAITSNAAGILYVADTEDQRIRRIALDGTVTKLSGLGTSGFKDGTAGTSRFWNPSGIALKGDGSILYVADRFNQRIRIVSTTDGSAGTLAGDAPPPVFGDPKATGGFADGWGAAAQFDEPVGIAVGPDTYLYVCDSANNRIRRISPAGDVTTVAGQAAAGSADGVGAAASFNVPLGIAVGGDGALYVTEGAGNRIRKIVLSGGIGTVSTFAGSGTAGLQNGAVADARFQSPFGIAVDMLGHVYVADSKNHVVREIFGGQVTTLAGTGVAGYAEGKLDAAKFNEVSGILVASPGVWYVADSLSHRIRKLADPVRACN